MTKHPALLNLERYWKKEITLEELIELNNKVCIEKLPPVVLKAQKMFGHEKSCPVEKEPEEWNY